MQIKFKLKKPKRNPNIVYTLKYSNFSQTSKKNVSESFSLSKTNAWLFYDDIKLCKTLLETEKRIYFFFYVFKILNASLYYPPATSAERQTFSLYILQSSL